MAAGTTREPFGNRASCLISPRTEEPHVSLQAPTPDDLIELFRDEIVVREAEIDAEYAEIVADQGSIAWACPHPGVETLQLPGKPALVRVAFRRRLGAGGHDESDRVRHELRQLRNDVRAAVHPDCQVEFIRPGLTHVDQPDGLDVICYTHGIVRSP
jgi:hypothetical protein